MTIEELLNSNEKIQFRAPCTVSVGGKTYKVKQISNKVATKIHCLNNEALFLENEAKKEITLRRANKISKKLRTLHSKTAAYYILGNKALFVPFLFWFTWKRLDLRDSEHTFTINDAGANNRGYAFFLQNWQITKAQLALSTTLVGKSVSESALRKESAENMLAEDASPKKAEEGK
jgi:hypothetical protein